MNSTYKFLIPSGNSWTNSRVGINLKEKIKLVQGYWSPKILGELNGNFVKVFKAKGEFVWHQHDDADELFLVIQGQLKMLMPDGEIVLKDGEVLIVPKGVQHCPVAEKECHVLLFEPKNVVNTGDAQDARRVEDLEWI